MNFNFFVKSNIVFGCGAIKQLPSILDRYGCHTIMVVYDHGVKAAGIADKVLAEVRSTGVEMVIFDEVIPNPTNEVVERAAEAARAAKVDGFVAVGGGSSIDMAKAVNLLMTNPGTIGEYGGVNKVKSPCLPLVAIPTTAGTSSEVTNVSALIDTEKVIKYVVIDNNIVASDVIADPDFTRTLPVSVTAATGMDAITHAVESYISNVANPLTEYHALEGLKILCQNLPLVVKNPEDMAAREQMMLGCIITGFSFSNANLGLVHGIAHTLSAHFGLAHGMANAAVLPYVMEYNADCCAEKMVEMARAIGLSTSGDINKDKYLLSAELKLLISKLGIKTLSQQCIKQEDFAVIVRDTLKEPVLGFNPRQGITDKDILAILEKAY